ncbi:MAG: GntR family transcriptional regulator [Muribaculaceae bacterium]|nr:GntR family transcriptional regulator [Muribaculaceae bacterium]MDE6703511.1 GntR family transcriptional regulator [Muribaculaceae bacterium]
MIDFNNNSKAIYLQIADDICDKVLTSEFAPDQRIPSVREYAAQVEVNVNTVMRAYDYLAGLEIIYNKRGLGFFAAADSRRKVIELRRREVLGDGVQTVFRQLAMLDITPAQLSEMYQQYLETQN